MLIWEIEFNEKAKIIGSLEERITCMASAPLPDRDGMQMQKWGYTG